MIFQRSDHLQLRWFPSHNPLPSRLLDHLRDPRLKMRLCSCQVAAGSKDIEDLPRVDSSPSVDARGCQATTHRDLVQQEREGGDAADGSTAQDGYRLPRKSSDVLVEREE